MSWSGLAPTTRLFKSPGGLLNLGGWSEVKKKVPSFSSLKSTASTVSFGGVTWVLSVCIRRSVHARTM